MNPILKRTLAVLALVWSVSAQAATVSIIYTGDNDLNSNGDVVAAVGDVLTFDIVVDMEDRIVLGGAFDLFFDTDQLGFVSIEGNVVGDELFYRLPDERLDEGWLETWSFGATEGIAGVNTVGTLTFELVDAASGANPAIIDLTNSLLVGNPWIDAEDFVTIVDVDYGSIRIVPLPGAVWLLLAALGSFAGLRKARQPTLS